MNERIEKLVTASFPGTSLGVLMMYSPELEKFAELVVRECIEQASISNGHGNNQWDKALTFAADNIKKHFGVEE